MSFTNHPICRTDGPNGARYNNALTGWFDGETFTDWFKSLNAPKVKAVAKGKKVLIYYNLSSHISERILNACREDSIQFVCLPRNSTHLTSAFFLALQQKQGEILSDYKNSGKGMKSSSPKTRFPNLLKGFAKEY
jgi:hypothetical protein